MAGRSVLGALLLAATALPAVQAQPTPKFDRDCADWIAKKGYSSDYIEQRTGERQAGRARQWRSNITLDELAPGDAVLQGVDSADGRGQRVAIVDSVLRHEDGSIRAVQVSEMNFGKLVDARCHVTENFGKVTSRTIAIDRLRSAWRPGK
jgi:hypothetical protein